MAIKKACLVSNSIRNTGKECDVAMGATAMIIAIDPAYKFSETDMTDEYTWLNTLIHQKKAFPLFGQKAPIRAINNNTEADVLVTLDDGSRIFVRYGMYNREFMTTSGGLCYADALQSFLGSGYSILEVDQTGRMLARVNSDKTFSGLITDFMYSPSPQLADFKDVYRNKFQYVFSPNEMVNNGIILDGASSILSLMGLIDATITKAAIPSVTKLKISVKTNCKESDLIALLATPLATVSNFVVTNKATGAVVVPTGAAIVAGVIELTGTYTTGQTYITTGSSPATWFANLIQGYDASGSSAEHLIP